MNFKSDGGKMINSLTGLRFYAAFLVFIHHIVAYVFGRQNDCLGWLEPVINSFGHLGVSIFFVLSGFVLYINYQHPGISEINVKNFYIARFARIYPVFLVTTIVAIPIQWLSPTKHYFWEPLLLNLTLLQTWFPVSFGSFNEVAWTIGVEAFFYAVFPIMVYSVFLSKKPAFGFVLVVILYAFYQVMINNHFGNKSFFTAMYFPPNRLLEFVAGMMGGYIYQQKSTSLAHFIYRFPKYIIGGIITGLVLLLLFIPTQISLEIEHVKYLSYIIPSTALILILASTETNNKTFAFFNAPIVILGGEISYSLYLIHNLLLSYAKNGLKIVFHYDIQHAPFFTQLVLALFIIAVGLYSAYLLYNWVEIPGRRLIKNELMKKRKIPDGVRPVRDRS